MVKVRFAPSPTGNLHIGGSRTALFNWLYAQAKKGKFILRIEDTDRVRSKKEYEEEILDSLKWLGFNWDEIYYQSQRLDIYHQQAQRLLKEGKAYVEKPETILLRQGFGGLSCEALAKEGRAQKPEDKDQSPENRPDTAFLSSVGTCREQGGEAIIFKVEPQKIKINDLIRGEIIFDAATIKDQVLIKSDGTPTYNFACVVDDALMNITHVIRGDDHISNTPKQVLLYQALGLPLPQFAHLPLILAKEGGRMSKRKGATAISEYRKMGYLAEALVNFLMLLGWAPGDNREIIDINEAIKRFDIKDVNKTAAIMDIDKLEWFNNHYLKNKDPNKLTDEVIPLLIEKNLINENSFDRNYIFSLVKLYQGRMTVLPDFAERADFFFLGDISIEPKAKEKFLSQDLSKEFFLFIERIEKLEEFTVENIEKAFRELVAELGIEAKVLIHPMRAALTGKTVGPGLFEVIYYLGKERVKERLCKFIKRQ